MLPERSGSTAILRFCAGNVPLARASIMSPETPKRLGRYELHEEIGRGMMGVVYRATDPELHRTLALKTVQLAWAITDEDRELFERRFLTEARVAAGLSHPGIVVVHDVGRDPVSGTVYIALEFLEGRTLGELSASGTPLQWREALRIGARVAEALQHAHDRGVVHRDVKPANVMVLRSGEPKIMDFGIAKVPASQVTAAGEFFGTPSYMSPEQAAADTVDGRSDLFSLGAVIYLLLTGRRAFDAQGVAAILARVASQDPPPPSQLAPDLPPDVDYVVRRALAKDPAHRYADCRSLAEDLNDILEGRAARHRAAWSEPPRAEGTLASKIEAGTADPRTALRPTLPRAAATLRSDPKKRLWAISLVGLSLLAITYLSARKNLVAKTAANQPSPSRLGEAEPSPTRTSATARPSTEESTFGSLWPPKIRFLPAPAHLQFELEHGLRRGTLKVFVDDTLTLERNLGAPIRKRILFYKVRKQVLRETLDLKPGEHLVRVQVADGGDVWSERIFGLFEGDKTRRLVAKFGGIIGKELDLAWGTPPP